MTGPDLNNQGPSLNSAFPLRWSYIYDHSTALFPSIYLGKRALAWTPAQKQAHIATRLEVYPSTPTPHPRNGRLQAALAKAKGHKLPVYAFTKLAYDAYDDQSPFYSKASVHYASTPGIWLLVEILVTFYGS